MGEGQVNSSVNNGRLIYPSHPDLFQAPVWVGTIENYILYNIRATGMETHGLNIGKLKDCAFVNILFSQTGRRPESMLGGNFDHVLMWHMTYLGGFTWYGTENYRNFSARNNIFAGFYAAPNNVPLAMAVAEAFMTNNHFLEPTNAHSNAFMAGTNSTLGLVEFTDIKALIFNPANGLLNRITTPIIPADLEGRAINPGGAIGALQQL